VEPRQLHLIVETRDAILHRDDIEVGLEERKTGCVDAVVGGRADHEDPLDPEGARDLAEARTVEAGLVRTRSPG
jgi:hypothetical protein